MPSTGCGRTPPAASDAIQWRGGQSPVSENMPETLTERELQIAQLVAQGLSNKEVGRRLDISDGKELKFTCITFIKSSRSPTEPRWPYGPTIYSEPARAIDPPTSLPPLGRS